MAMAMAPLALPLSISAAVAGTVPEAVDLGTLGGPASRADGVSGNTVVGTSSTPGDADYGHAFAYDLSSGEMTDVGALVGGLDSEAKGVSGDTVVGSRVVRRNEAWVDRAFVYDLGSGTVTGLGTLGGRESRADAVSGDTVVGTAATSHADHAFAYNLSSGLMTDLGTLRGGGQSYARAVSGDTVVGTSTVGEAFHAFAYDLGSGTMTDLGTLGGIDSSATGVSGDTVVGHSYTSRGVQHAFAYSLSKGTMTDLGTLGGSYSYAEGVSGNTVVGNSDTSTGDTGAFAYDLSSGTMTALGPGVFGGGFSLATAVSADTIVGYAGTGWQRAVVWGGPTSFVHFAQSTLSRSEDAGTVSLPVNRAGKTDIAASVHYAADRGTATPGQDFTLTPGTLTFAPGQTTATIPVSIINDTHAENPETIVVSLSSPGEQTIVGIPASITVTVRTSDQQPDALVGTAARSGYLGNNIYNTTGAGQTKTVAARRTRTRIFYVRVANDGNVTNRFAVTGSRAMAGSTVTFYAGTTNITTAMRSKSGWRLALTRGTAKTITMHIKVRPNAAIGSKKPGTVTATWTGDGIRTDLVRGVVRVRR